MTKLFTLNLLGCCGLILFMGMTVQGEVFIEQLGSGIEGQSYDFSINENWNEEDVLQTGWMEGLGLQKTERSYAANGCGEIGCGDTSCCTLPDCASPVDVFDGCDGLSCTATPYSEFGSYGDTCGCGIDCGSGCGLSSGCECGIDCDCNKKFMGCLQSTPCGWSDFISPITNPVFFEDPRTLSEARFMYINHKTPRNIGSSTIQVAALQVRAALTDRLSLIATKDGFIMSDFALVDDGWADIAAGLKYNLYKDVDQQRILSTGMTFEVPVGTSRSQQGNGDGEFHIFLTGGVEVAEGIHWLSGSGFRLPADTAAESQSWYWSNHLDYEITKGIYLLGEVNWFHWTKSGQGGVNGVAGQDLFNLGSTGVAGNDLVTGAIGFKVKPTDNQEIGFAWELPLTENRDVIDDRYTVDWIVRF
ncbi:hypothetical protein Pla110_13970 [Polystyrenella longa]|uniref:Uncharacterized protein n=1 Tax=Polystyrenella longa TaxID=2528007 RepID=A0A518CKC8_9PLAN|nr:hypothetical protein [Polystyrenella longa]QDU79683.1 hypothetical protein Pla110_13970 [Polystyrenella longa]